MRPNMNVKLVGMAVVGVLLLAATRVPADDVTAGTAKADRERRVRVALALAATEPTAANCGKCREDVDEARADALRDQKPLVLFVGGPCDGLAKTAEGCGAIPAKIAEYKSDNRPRGERRIVVLSPEANRNGFLIAATLPAGSSRAELIAAVERAKPVTRSPAPAKLSWDF